MKLLRIINIFLLVLFCLMVLYGLVHSATVNAESCSLAHVQAAVNSASRGDTVSVPAGACTWTDHLLVTKAIKLHGAGKTEDANGTRITINNATPMSSTYYSDSGQDCPLNMGDSGSQAGEGVVFWIQNATLDAEEIVEVKNFVFYQSTSVSRILVFLIINGDASHPLQKVMIHDNLLRLRQDSGGSEWTHAIATTGYVWGVFYNNVIHTRKPVISVSGNSLDDGVDNGYCAYYAGKHTWRNYTFTPGTQNTFVFEDNIWYFNVTSPTHMGGTGKGGLGMTVRYNSYYNQDPWGQVQSGHDAHGSYTSGYSPLGIEIYGNYYQGNSGCYVGNNLSQCIRSGYVYPNPFTVVLGHLRCGRVMVWNNYARNLGSDNSLLMKLWLKRACDECADDFNVDTTFTCPSTTTMTGCRGKKRCTADGQPYYISDSYIFQNRLGEAGTSIGAAGTNLTVSSEELASCYSPSTIMPRENIEWWRDNESCSGSGTCSAGIGCGPNIPTGNCTEGVGYWVTNQSCSQLTTANVGATTDGNFAAKRREGTFYRCVSTNVWEPYYTPLPYPHPLRTDIVDTDPPQYVAGTSIPSTPSGSPVECVTDPQDQTIGFTVTENSGSTVYCRFCDACNVNTTYAQMPEANVFINTNLVQTVTIPNQPCNASYLYYARCIDPVGNESDPIIISYNVDASDDSTAPTIEVFRLDANGRDLYLTANEPIKVGTGGSGGWVLTKNSTDVVDLTFASVIDKTLRYQTAIPILSTDTLAIVYTQPTGGIQDLSDNDLEDISSTAVVNDSTQGNEVSTSLFDHSSAPTYETTTSPNAVNLGVRFQSTNIGRIDEICFYKDAGMDGETHVGTVYDSTGAVLANHTFSDETESGWQCETLSAPVGILNAVNYTVAVHFPSKYVYTRNFFTSAYMNTDEILSASNLNGRYVYAASSLYPTSVALFKPNYWVDFVVSYQGAGGPWLVTVLNASSSGAKCTVQDSRVVDNGNATEVEVEVANGWKATFSGCGAGSTVQSGNQYTHTTAAITENCTVEVICEQRRSPLWLIP